jgi:hypothetical protein
LADFFDKLFGDVCMVKEVDLQTRITFDTSLTNLCSTGRKYIYPKRAKSGNRWYYIINTGN